jgi:preprotein translocase subunit SecG
MLKYYDIIFIVVSLIVIILSLLQGGKSEGASGAITGGGLNVFAKTKERGSEKVVSWLTFGFAVLFLFLALLIMVINASAAASSSAANSAAASKAAVALFLR